MPGLRAAWTAREPRWPDTCAHLFNALTCLLNVSPTSMSTWLVLFLLYGYTHMFTVVDRSTRWPAAYPIQDTTTTACINALVEWISCFGIPATVTSDRGSICIQHLMTTTYHPQSNGMVERMHLRLKVALVARCSSTSWPSELTWVLLGLRSVPLEKSGVSSTEFVFGTPLTIPGQFLSMP